MEAATEPAQEEPVQPAENKEEIFARRLAENDILRRAASLRETIARAAKAEQRVEAQNKRPKCHWDYLLAEMTWLAMDFAAERTWKAAAANATARRATAKSKEWQDALAQGRQTRSDKKAPAKAATPAAAAKDKAAKEKEKEKEKAAPVPELTADDTDPDDQLAEQSADFLVYASFDDLAAAFEKLEEKHRTDEADFQHQLIVWDHNERRRQKAVAELVRQQREEEEPRGDDLSPAEDYDGDPRKGKRKTAKLKAKPYAPVLREELQQRQMVPQQLTAPNKRLRTSATQQAAARAAQGGPSRQLSSLPSSLAGSQQDLQDQRWMSRPTAKKKKVDDDDLPYNAKMDYEEMGSRRVGGFVRDKRGQQDTRRGQKQPVAAQGNQRRVISPQPVAAVVIAWTPAEDELLKVIIREFCPLRPNWALVSDIFSSGSAMRGVYRRWEHCKQRWEVLLPSVEPMDKDDDERARATRRHILQRFLPSDEETLKLHLERLIFVSGRIRSRKAAEKKEMAPSSAQRMLPSSSWTATLQHVSFRDPLEMAGSMVPYARGGGSAAPGAEAAVAGGYGLPAPGAYMGGGGRQLPR